MIKRGFTLIELLVVIAVIGILAVGFASVGTNFLTRSNSENVANDLSSNLRIAQLNSIYSKRNSSWGVRVQGDEIVLFVGASYATRNTTYDEHIAHPSTVTITPATAEVVFTEITGDATPITFTVTNNLGETKTIGVNSEGVLDVN